MKRIKQSLKPPLLENLERLVERALPLLPGLHPDIDWSVCKGAMWRKQAYGGFLEAVRKVSDVALGDILGVDRQKALTVQNTRQFVQGLPANNVLLTGARGSGKSSLVQALLNEFYGDGLRVIQVDKTDLADLIHIVELVEGEPYRFLIFCDDLSFEAQDEGYKALKSTLDGSLSLAPDNVIIYATSNRRHLIPEYKHENDETRVVEQEIHHGEAVEEKISLSDRFGLWVSFHPVSQQQYLDIVEHWIGSLADKARFQWEWNDTLRSEALRWALARGNRSGRAGYQFARHWVGQQLLYITTVD